MCQFKKNNIPASGPDDDGLDNAIHRINRYPEISVNKTNHAIRWIVIYPVDSVIHLLNNPAQTN